MGTAGAPDTIWKERSEGTRATNEWFFSVASACELWDSQSYADTLVLKPVEFFYGNSNGGVETPQSESSSSAASFLFKSLCRMHRINIFYQVFLWFFFLAAADSLMINLQMLVNMLVVGYVFKSSLSSYVSLA